MRKKLFTVWMCAALVLTGCSSAGGENTAEITPGENQKLVYAAVTQIQGNEITYMELNES